MSSLPGWSMANEEQTFLEEILAGLSNGFQGLFGPVYEGPSHPPSTTDLLNGFLPVFLVAFVVTLLVVPVVRWIAIQFDIVDKPDGGRKIHRYPVAYLGGAGVFAGVVAGIVSFDPLVHFSNPLPDGFSISDYPPVSFAVVFGILAIFVTGLLDDIFHWDPRLKLAGQLVAAGALALSDFGTGAATGLLSPFFAWMPAVDLTPAAASFDGLREMAKQAWISDISLSTIDGGRESLRVWGVEYAMKDDQLVPIVPEGANLSWAWNPFYTLDGVYYWAGVVLIGVVVLGACNAANLLDGLDGLLSGTVGTMAVGFVAVAMLLAIADVSDHRAVTDAREILFSESGDLAATTADFVVEGEAFAIEEAEASSGFSYQREVKGRYDPLAGSRIVIALALLGACLGFLPYNFNPAVIFLGDAGSMLIGFICAVLILTLGSEGNTEFVIAGLIVFSLPIMDTVLAILRRKLSGLPMSAADRNHIHHMVLRAAGSVPRAVFALYAICSIFVLLGVVIVWMNMLGEIRNLAIYAVALVLFGFIAAVAIKIALRNRWMQETVAERNQEKIIGGIDDVESTKVEQKAG